MRSLPVLLAILMVFNSRSTQASEGPVSNTEVRKLVERTLPFIEKEGVAWMQQRKCISCHHVSFMIWAHNDARAKGISVDTKKIEEWTEWSAQKALDARTWFKLSRATMVKDGPPSFDLETLKPVLDKSFVTEDEFLTALKKALPPEEFDARKPALLKTAALPKQEGTNGGGGIASVNQLLLGCAPGSPKMNELIAYAPTMLATFQEKDGRWPAKGQWPSENRPIAESDLIMTGWGALALKNKFNPPTDAIRKMEELAYTKLKTVPAPVSCESFSVALLVEAAFGTPERTQAARAQLLKHQNADGGWPWLLGAPSDAFATGQAIYALSYSGQSASDAPVQSGLKFLLDTQMPDGAWPMLESTISKPDCPAGRRKSVTPIQRYWAATWAVLGAAKTLPPAE